MRQLIPSHLRCYLDRSIPSRFIFDRRVLGATPIFEAAPRLPSITQPILSKFA